MDEEKLAAAREEIRYRTLDGPLFDSDGGTRVSKPVDTDNAE